MFIAAAAALVLLSWQLPAPWRYPVAAAACAGVWAFWQLVRPQRIAGRHRARAGGGRQEQIDELEAMLAPGTDVIEFGGLGRAVSKTAGKH
ncbi:MAG TPA: hypothetical protein DGT23_24030 [Micromonosporaceae bacterium]|nr:hypothetical protein [Micromonosporaceae bacterium]